MKRGALLTYGAIALVIILVIVMVAMNPQTPQVPTPSSDPSPTTESTPLPRVPAPLPASTATPAAVDADGTELIDPFVAAEAAARTDTTTTVEFEEIATGEALEDMEINTHAMIESGLSQVGSPAVISATVMSSDETANPPAMTVRMCLDYSEVDVQAPDGSSVKDPNASQRVASILVLNQIEGRWLVAKRTFPDDPTC